MTISIPGRGTDLVYRTLERVPARRLAVHAHSRWLTSRDEIDFEEREGDGARITCTSGVRLRAALGALDPLLSLGLRRAGDRALAGLRRRLAELERDAGTLPAR